MSLPHCEAKFHTHTKQQAVLHFSIF
jgi:hypothetical protein